MHERMLGFLQGLTNGIKEASDPAALKQLLASARLALRIFFSMNSPGLTEVPFLPAWAPISAILPVAFSGNSFSVALSEHHSCVAMDL